MSAIDTLIAQISDPRLRERLAAEWDNAKKEKKFGLVFEDHLPELLPLHGAKPRKGDLVCRRKGALKDVWQIKSIHAGVATCVKPSNEAHPSEPTRAAAEPVQFMVDELLVVREFGEPIFPALVPVDAVANGPLDAPWHTLIEADNYHALQLLDYLYAGQVDCIYIDPPYNTGARDWKYNNDYVDGNDGEPLKTPISRPTPPHPTRQSPDEQAQSPQRHQVRPLCRRSAQAQDRNAGRSAAGHCPAH